MTSSAAAWCVVMALGTAGPAAAAEPSLPTVLERAGAYVSMINDRRNIPHHK